MYICMYICMCRSMDTLSEFHAEATQAIASEGLARGPYVADRAGFKPATFRTKGDGSTNEPPRPTYIQGWNFNSEHRIEVTDCLLSHNFLTKTFIHFRDLYSAT